MHFDVPKVVRSPGYDHGHDEESRNGRYIKIDILDDYIRTPEGFREISDKTGAPGGYRNPPRGYWAFMGPKGEEERRQEVGYTPPLPSANRTRRGGRRPPLSFSPSTSPSWTRREGEEVEERKERGGAAPLPLSYSD